MAAVAPALKVGCFDFILLLLGELGSLIVETTYLSCVSAASFNSIDPEMTTIVHRAHKAHPKFFVA